MKNIFNIIIITILVTLISSCNHKKDYPTINFIGGNGLISQNSVLESNKTFKVGINSITKSDSKLYEFKIARLCDNEYQIILDSIIDVDNYNTILSLPTSNGKNNERWVFSVMCDDGYSSEISVLIKTSDDTTDVINQNEMTQKQYIQRDLPGLDLSNVPFYIGFGVLLVLGIIIYLIKKPKKDYIESEEIKKIKELINFQNKKFDGIDDFINKKINYYEKRLDDLQQKLNSYPKNKSYLLPMIMAILISVVLFISFLFSNFLLL